MKSKLATLHTAIIQEVLRSAFENAEVANSRPKGERVRSWVGVKDLHRTKFISPGWPIIISALPSPFSLTIFLARPSAASCNHILSWNDNTIRHFSQHHYRNEVAYLHIHGNARKNLLLGLLSEVCNVGEVHGLKQSWILGLVCPCRLLVEVWTREYGNDLHYTWHRAFQ